MREYGSSAGKGAAAATLSGGDGWRVNENEMLDKVGKHN